MQSIASLRKGASRMAKQKMVGSWAFVVGGAGLVIGAGAALLAYLGNPGNMGLCIACFLRDAGGFFAGAGAGMGGVAYIRPEIIGLIVGAAIAALVWREFKPRGGSSVAIRFVLGFIFMAAALIFLGCTVRAWLRLGGGDLNALFGVAGIVAGVAVGTVLLKQGFNLGRAGKLPIAVGVIGPVIAVLLFVLAVAAAAGIKPAFFTVTPAGAKSTAEKAVISADGKVLKPEGARMAGGAIVGPDGAVVSPKESVAQAKPMPGGKRAPLIISLIGGLLLGVVAQRSRFCSIGGIRDAILVRRFELLFGVAGLVVGAFVVNVALGRFNLGFVGQPVAHTDALGNFAAMTVAGLAAVLLGGCPFRQVVITGEGDADALAAVAGMGAGAVVTHGFNLASSAKGLAPNAWIALAVMAAVLLGIGLFKREQLVAATAGN